VFRRHRCTSSIVICTSWCSIETSGWIELAFGTDVSFDYTAFKENQLSTKWGYRVLLSYKMSPRSVDHRNDVVATCRQLSSTKVDGCTNTPMICSGESFLSPKCRYYVTLVTPTQGTVSHHKAITSHGQPVDKI